MYCFRQHWFFKKNISVSPFSYKTELSLVPYMFLVHLPNDVYLTGEFNSVKKKGQITNWPSQNERSTLLLSLFYHNYDNLEKHLQIGNFTSVVNILCKLYRIYSSAPNVQLVHSLVVTYYKLWLQEKVTGKSHAVEYIA